MSDNLHPNWSIKTQAANDEVPLSNEPVLAGKQLSRRPAAVFGIVIALVAGYWLYGFADNGTALPAQVVTDSAQSSSIASQADMPNSQLPVQNNVPEMMQSGLAPSPTVTSATTQVHNGAPVMQYQTVTVTGKGKGVVTTTPPVQPQSGPGAWIAAIIAFVAVYKSFMLLQRNRIVYS